MSQTPDPEALQSGHPPPVDFRILLQSFASQAMVSMGKMQNPLTGKTEVNLPWARYFIDVIAMLEEKTKANLDPAESSVLTSTLNTLRLTFVETEKEEGA